MGNASGRFCGNVGFVRTEEDAYGVARPVSTERWYYGDVLNLTARWQKTEHLNDDLDITKRISFLADPYAIQYFNYIRYVEWMGVRWEVKSTELHYPRLTMNVGGVYNGEQT